MVRQYPYRLFVLVDTPAVYDDETGVWTPGTSTLTDLSPCRDEANGAGNLITLADGSQYLFNSSVFLPQGATLKEGDYIEVKDGDTVRVKGNIKRFHNGQLNSQIWL